MQELHPAVHCDMHVSLIFEQLYGVYLLMQPKQSGMGMGNIDQ